MKTLKSLLLQNQWDIFNQTWHIALESIFLYEGATPSLRGDNYKIVKMHWQILKSSSPELLDKFFLNLTQSLQMCAPLTRSQCKVYDNQMTVKAFGPLVFFLSKVNKSIIEGYVSYEDQVAWKITNFDLYMGEDEIEANVWTQKPTVELNRTYPTKTMKLHHQTSADVKQNNNPFIIFWIFFLLSDTYRPDYFMLLYR